MNPLQGNCFYNFYDPGWEPFGWNTERKTFYDKIGEEVFKIDLTTEIYIGEHSRPSNIVKTLTLELSPACDATNVTKTTMTYSSSNDYKSSSSSCSVGGAGVPLGPYSSNSFSSGGSTGSSVPEGFVIAFVPSSSSFDTPVETSVSSGGSMASSVPEGFVFAFGDPSTSSSPSVASSTPEGFVFAFTASSKADN